MAGGIGVDAAAKGAGDAPEIGVGMLGYAFMGKAHANGYKKLSYMAWPPPLQPRLVSIAGRDEAAVAEAAERYGFDRYVTDWHELVADPDVQLFDNSGPNNLHAEPTIAAAEAGKHVFCEKPLGRDRRREPRHLAARRRDRRPAHDAPSTTASCRPCGSRAKCSRRVSSATSSTSAAGTCRSGGRRRRMRGGSTRARPARAHSATSART